MNYDTWVAEHTGDQRGACDITTHGWQSIRVIRMEKDRYRYNQTETTSMETASMKTTSMKTTSMRNSSMETASVEITSMEQFVQNRSKAVYFVRLSGRGADFEKELYRMDDMLRRQMREGRLLYQRVGMLPVLSGADEIRYYTQRFDQWERKPQDGIVTKVSKHRLAVRLGTACAQTLQKYLDTKAAVTESMRKNFAVKLLYWFDFVCAGFPEWREDSCVKIVADHVAKEQEYLFYELLALTGCEVLLLPDKGDRTEDSANERKPVARDPDKIVVKIPPRNRKKDADMQKGIQTAHTQVREKSFEELAALASSIVLILVHDKDGEVIATGSGIMVAKAGYILTNDHVVRGGYSYSVRIENDDQVYHTDELIKYHWGLDLALLRIQRQLDPIPIYQGQKKLVRGQAVAAIGSPLGLFNSISDGIISGFRTIDGVDMIQFTAPISNGSSGGAVLNMYGEVIGISTAGFDRGQNINLAVGYESIRLFIQGFQS